MGSALRYGRVVVIAFGSIEDLRVLATTVGVASAGIVIALQDVATSMLNRHVSGAPGSAPPRMPVASSFAAS